MHIRASNFTFFQFPTNLNFVPFFGPDPEDIFGEDDVSALEANALKPIGPLEMATSGFVRPVEDHYIQELRLGAEDALWIAVGTTAKILPAAALNEKLAAKIREVEDQHGRKPGGRERKRLKDELLTEMLPQAFSKTAHTHALIFPARGLIAVATASRKVAETVVSEVREALGSFPALPINAEVAPRSVMTGWIAGEPLPDNVGIGYSADLHDAIEGGAKIKITDSELHGPEVEAHLEAGRQVVKLALVNGDRSTFTVDEKLVLRKLRIGETVMDEFNDSADRENETAYQTATMTIIAAELLQVFGIMQAAFKLTPASEG